MKAQGMKADHIRNMGLSNLDSFIRPEIYKDENIALDHQVVVALHTDQTLLDYMRHNIVRIKEFRMIYVKRGSVNVVINLVEYHLSEGALFVVSRDSIIEFKSASVEFDINGILVSDEILSIALGGNQLKKIGSYGCYCCQKLSSVDRKIVEEQLFSLCRAIKYKRGGVRVVASMLATILWHVDFIMAEVDASVLSERTRAQQIYDSFISLVNQHCTVQHTLVFYASELCITERHLGTVVKNVSGEPAKHWIDRAIVYAAKVRLQHSDKQVCEIAEELSFSNVAFFCKFFKRETGQTPNEYRRMSK